MTTIRVICSKCGSKLDIRAELAGSTRRCPKCKTEFQVPSPAEELPAEDDGMEEGVVAAAPDDSAQSSSAPLSSPDIVPPEAPLDSEDDDDDDYLPSFVTETAAEKKASAKSAPKTSPSKDDDDDGPVLSIPKVPPPSRPKSHGFDPDAFLNDEPQRPTTRDTPPPATKDRSPRNRFGNDFDDGDTDILPKKSRSTGPRDLHLPSPEKTGLSDPGVRSDGGTRDRAQAARELRQALKDSALKGPQEPEKAGGFGVDLSVFLSEVGIKGFGIFAGSILFAFLLYFISYRMMVGGPKLPPLGYVSGTVTLDGATYAGATVYFAPVDTAAGQEGKKKIVPRTSIGVTDEKGHYKMMYQEGIPGVTVGKCRIWVALPPPQVALEYSLAAQNMKDVTAGNNPNVDLALTSPPKRK